MEEADCYIRKDWKWLFEALSTSALSLGVVSQQMRWIPLYHFSPSKIESVYM